ncbi:hypothetical protein PR202_ga08464 [Eleusine coracana subsp. coracana]|uniref:Uncharacterized protein n=1 Tax=Eleusine coracana subsp. coracana TaxID=191504 RepID=A0AAV5C2Q6_ELECO|nr:hypothetical protein PR202_ga08464 [Eleusine coracana subsp. coracana]
MADAVEALPPLESRSGVESGRSSPSPTASPEFEFWMVGKNPSSFQSPALLTADELFSGGVVLPLHTLQAAPSPTDGDAGDANEAAAEEVPDSAGLGAPAAEAVETESEATKQPLAESNITPTPDLPAVTFKWKDIFKANNNNNGGSGGEAKEQRKKAERRVSSVSGNAELININIWPFSRSRSAGHGSGGGGAAVSSSLSIKSKPNPNTNVSNNVSSGVVVANNNAGVATAPAGSGRKASSAPCSRSNSRGDSGPEPGVITTTTAAAIPDPAAVEAAPVPGGPTSMLRRLVPGRNNAGGGGGSSGIRVGRPSAVWQLRRNKLLQQTAAEQQKQAASSRGFKKKAPPALAAAEQAASGRDDKNASEKQQAAASVSVGCRSNAEGGVEEGGPNPPQDLFGLRTFFSKKVY